MMDSNKNIAPLILALGIALVPHARQLPPWVVLWCVTCWGYLLIAAKFHWPGPGKIIRSILTAGGILGLLLTSDAGLDRYSSVALLWIMASFGFAGSLLHVLNHSIFKSLLFLGAGAVLQKTGTRHIDQLGGLLKRMPTTGKTFLVGSISISGLPPFNGFISEFLIYYGAFQGLTLNGSSFIFTMLGILSRALSW